MKIISTSNMNIEDAEKIRKHISEIEYLDCHDWNKLGIVIGIDHPAFSDVKNIIEQYETYIPE